MLPALDRFARKASKATKCPLPQAPGPPQSHGPALGQHPSPSLRPGRAALRAALPPPAPAKGWDGMRCALPVLGPTDPAGGRHREDGEHGAISFSLATASPSAPRPRSGEEREGREQAGAQRHPTHQLLGGAPSPSAIAVDVPPCSAVKHGRGVGMLLFLCDASLPARLRSCRKVRAPAAKRGSLAGKKADPRGAGSMGDALDEPWWEAAAGEGSGSGMPRSERALSPPSPVRRLPRSLLPPPAPSFSRPASHFPLSLTTRQKHALRECKSRGEGRGGWGKAARSELGGRLPLRVHSLINCCVPNWA